MARQPTPTSRGTVLLQPVAAPVDTFVNPGPTNGLLDLAGSLRTLAPEINETLAIRAAAQKEKDLKQADADFLTANADGLAEGVRQGLIPPQASKAYMQRYKANQGEAIGRRLQAGFLPAWDAWEGKNSDDPATFDKFYADYVKANVGTEDPDIIAGLMPSVRQLGSEALDTQSRFRTKQVREGALQGELAGVNSILDDANYDGLASGSGTDHAGSADAIEQQRQAYIATGGTGADFDKNAMGLIAAKAIELQDPAILGFFDRKVPGEDYSYGDTPDGSRLKQEATEQLAVRARQSVVEGDRVAERERKAREDAAQRAAIDAMVSGEEIPEEVLAAGESADPLFRSRIGEWRENLSKGARDPALVKQIKDDIVAGGGVQAVIRAMPSIDSGDDLTDLITFAKSFEGARPTIDDVLGSTSAKNVLSALDSRTKAAGSFLDPVTGMTNEGLEAQHDFRIMMAQWAVANPDATALEREEAIAKTGKLLLDRLTPSADNPGVSTYERDEAAVGGFANPYSAGMPTAEAPPAMEEASKVDQTADPEADARTTPPMVAGRWGSTAEPGSPGARADGLSTDDAAFFDAFSPTEQESIRKGAAARGGNLGTMLEHVRKQGIKPKAALTAPATPKGAAAPDGTPIDPVSFRPDGEPPRPADVKFLSSFAQGGATRPDSFTGMRPEFSSGIEAMIRAAPPEIQKGLKVYSGYRSPEKQAELWKQALRKYGSAAAARKWVAPPGRSGHNHGHAADLKFASPAVKNWVHANAGKFGLDFPLSNEDWHVELAGARNGGSGEGRRSFTQKDAESFLNAALSLDALDLPSETRDDEGAFVPGDVAAGRLLDLIGQHEGGGNYNAVFGNADATRDLGKLTLDQIITQQRISKRRGAYSTAIGKYQFLRKTLEGLKEELGLTGDEKFVPDLQDRLAVTLLNRRGYQDFKAGRISRQQFALRLSQEWSSVEKPGTGRSYYAGDGFHGGAPVKSRAVYAALGFTA